MTVIKNDVLSLLELYYKDKHKRDECIDRPYILVYYHRKSFGLSVSDDEVSDFLATYIQKQ